LVQFGFNLLQIYLQKILANRPISTISADSPFGELPMFCALGGVGQAKLKFPLFLVTKIFPAFFVNLNLGSASEASRKDNMPRRSGATF
jgi:hypothetical protein